MDIFDIKPLKNHGVTSTELGRNNKLSKNEKDKFIQNLIKKLFGKISEPVIKEYHYTVDRFEHNYAVCENRDTGEIINIDISKLPENIREGDILIYKDNNYSIDENERKNIEERINEKVKNIFED